MIIWSRDDAVDNTIGVVRLNWNDLVDLLALRQKGRATSQRFPSLKHVLWTVDTIWEHTTILIQTEDWILPTRRGRWCHRCCPGTPSLRPRADKRNPPCHKARMPHSRPVTTLSGKNSSQPVRSSRRCCRASCEVDHTSTNR